MSFKCPNCKQDFSSNKDALTKHLKENYKTCGRVATELLKNKMLETGFNKEEDNQQ